VTIKGDDEISVISHVVPTALSQVPMFETTVASQIVRNVGTASGLHAEEPVIL
jgi:hypothetical protein